MGVPLEKLIAQYQDYLPSGKRTPKLGEFGPVNSVEISCNRMEVRTHRRVKIQG